MAILIMHIVVVLQLLLFYCFVLLFLLISHIRWIMRLIKFKLNTSRRRIIFMSIL